VDFKRGHREAPEDRFDQGPSITAPFTGTMKVRDGDSELRPAGTSSASWSRTAGSRRSPPIRFWIRRSGSTWGLAHYAVLSDRGEGGKPTKTFGTPSSGLAVLQRRPRPQAERIQKSEQSPASRFARCHQKIADPTAGLPAPALFSTGPRKPSNWLLSP